jgi:hypothetical protein
MKPYSDEYWRVLVDGRPLRTRPARHRHIPRHVEAGLSQMHQVVPLRRRWWQQSAWRHVWLFITFAALLVLAIVWAGGKFDAL